MTASRILVPGLGLWCALALQVAAAAELPADAHIVYDVLYGGNELKIGRAEQRWRVDAGRYELQTELVPLLGPRVRYLSRGRIGPAGLVPESFAEFRGKERVPRTHADFDWATRTLRYGRGDEDKQAALEAGAQDLNALPFQLGWLGETATGRLQVATGKKVAQHRFSRVATTRMRVNGREVTAWPWRSDQDGDRTEVWVSPQLGHLPVRVLRVDDGKELQFVARELQHAPAKTAKR